MPHRERSQLLMGMRVTSLGTLISRILGMFRDTSTAFIFGMSGGVMDAFVVAFCLPNLFRRLFGEGALAASFLPVLSATLVEDRQKAWRLVSVLLTLLAAVLVLLLLAAEGTCALLWLVLEPSPRTQLVLGLSAVMLPYLWFICLAAQISATLHALGRFAAPALAPILLNLCWLVFAWFAAITRAGDQRTQAYILAVGVIVAGVLQLASQMPVLWSSGYRFDYHLPDVVPQLRRVMAAMLPMVLGLAATQISTFLDRWMAWALTARPDGQEIPWLGGAVNYPLQPGAASAIYLGERLYEFPQGILGMAVATVIFPLLSRHAARGHFDQLGKDLSLGLRLVLFVSIPASIGMVLMAEPVTRLLFEHGAFTSRDTARTARIVAIYGAGVWAYCAMPVLVRGYYALGNQRTPVRVGVTIIVFDFLANISLIWPMHELGLALSTALSAYVQTGLLLWMFPRHESPLAWRPLLGAGLRTTLATAAMATVCGSALWLCGPPGSLTQDAVRVAVPLVAGGVVFALTAWLLGSRELRFLLGRERPKATLDGLSA